MTPPLDRRASFDPTTSWPLLQDEEEDDEGEGDEDEDNWVPEDEEEEPKEDEEGTWYVIPPLVRKSLR